MNEKTHNIIISREEAEKIFSVYLSKKVDWEWGIAKTEEGIIPVFKIKNFNTQEKESFEYEIKQISLSLHEIIDIKIKDFNKEFCIIICPNVKGNIFLIKTIANTTFLNKYNEKNAKIAILLGKNPHIFQFPAGGLVMDFVTAQLFPPDIYERFKLQNCPYCQKMI
jgi:hypothetical protein